MTITPKEDSTHTKPGKKMANGKHHITLNPTAMSAQVFRWLVAIIISLLVIGGTHFTALALINQGDIEDLILANQQEHAEIRREFTDAVHSLEKLIIRCNNGGDCK